MKTTYLLLLCVLALLNSGCKKCPTTTHYPFPAATERYFGMYKPGNWWTYENQDGTKKDSIYFTQFFDDIAKDNTSEDCATWQSVEGLLNNNYLSANNTNITFLYKNPYVGNNKTETYVDLSGYNIEEPITTYKDGVFRVDTIYNNYQQSSKTYLSVLKTKYKRYFTPNIGLIRWEIGQDTFTLKNYHIK